MNQSGKMKLLLRSLLLSSLCALSSWSASSDHVVVTQSPDASVLEGQTVNISCCWTWRQSRVSINWLKNNKNIKSETILNQNSNSPEEQAKNCSLLIFTNFMSNASGTYTCRVTVEIPFLTVAEGNGTNITVITSSPTGPPSRRSESLPVTITLAVAAPLLLIALVCFCSLRRKKGQAARVIYEVPHTDSVGSEMDKHSTTSSRGSTQWCQVPVYDSLDYFERVEPQGMTKE